MIGGPFGALPHRDQREQSPQTIPVNDVQVPVAVAEKETLVGRLDDVFGINLVPQSGIDVPEGESDELVGEARKEFLGRGVVPVLCNRARNSAKEFDMVRVHHCSRITDLWRGAANFLPISEAAQIYSVETWCGQWKTGRRRIPRGSGLVWEGLDAQCQLKLCHPAWSGKNFTRPKSVSLADPQIANSVL